VARLAREGLSNPEIGARLFISPRIAQYHLSHAFTKLGITSRSQFDPDGVLGDRYRGYGKLVVIQKTFPAEVPESNTAIRVRPLADALPDWEVLVSAFW